MVYGLKVRFRGNRGKGEWMETVLPARLDGGKLGNAKARQYAERTADGLRSHGAIVQVVEVSG